MLAGVSLTDDNQLQVQIGPSGGYVTSGYFSGAGSEIAASTDDNGFKLTNANSGTDGWHGAVHFNLMDSSTNEWVVNGSLCNDGIRATYIGGSLALSGALERIQLMATGGNNFDAGKINISIT